ncbi:MAG TPA: hypothetical protein VFZ61_32380, partial [Polyangiales bacterium]
MSTYARIDAASIILPLLGVMALAAFSACTKTLVLGSDCPDETYQCTQDSVKPEPDPDDGMDAGQEPGSHDGSTSAPEDAGPRGWDAIVVIPDPVQPDGATDANLDAIATFSLLDVANPHFERNSGLGGDLVLAKLIGTLLPIPPIPLLFAELPNWYACWATTVHSVSRELMLDAGLDTDDYLMFVVNGTPVRQLLPQPLDAGAKYALEFTVQARPDPSERLVLEIRGANEECAVGDLLTSTRELPADAGWTPVCVEFATTRE